MAFVYRYTDNTDGIVKYIGISRNSETFKRRIKQHETDDVGKASKSWKIDYIVTKTMCDAQSLEGHFIAYYETYNYLNKAKCDWGLLSYIDESMIFGWTEYNKDTEDLLHDYFSVSDMDEELARMRNALRSADDEYRNTLDAIQKSLNKMETFLAEFTKNAVLHFINDCLVHTGSRKDIVQLDELHKRYCDWCDSNGVDCVADQKDFELLVMQRRRIEPYYMTRQKCLIGFCFVGSKEHIEHLEKLEDDKKRAMMSLKIAV